MPQQVVHVLACESLELMRENGGMFPEEIWRTTAQTHTHTFVYVGLYVYTLGA